MHETAYSDSCHHELHRPARPRGVSLPGIRPGLAATTLHAASTSGGDPAGKFKTAVRRAPAVIEPPFPRGSAGHPGPDFFMDCF